MSMGYTDVEWGAWGIHHYNQLGVLASGLDKKSLLHTIVLDTSEMIL